MRVMDAGHPARGPADEMRSSLAGPTVVRMLLGGRLRQLREASGMTRADAGWAIRGSDTKISRLETAEQLQAARRGRPAHPVRGARR